MKQLSYLILFLLFGAVQLVFTAEDENKTKDKWTSEEDQRNLQATLAMNASQFGAKSPEKFIFMQNRMGLRFEYNIDRSMIQIWISPQAGKSMLGTDRNFSNRDDHCNVFERITLTNINFSDFIRCDYDANHSILHFKNQKVHFATAFDKPVILVWFEKDDIVDFKRGRLAHLKVQQPDCFTVQYSERGKNFDFVAAIGAGEGKFRHQTRLEKGRSVYARAELSGGQVLAIGAELATEEIDKFTKTIVNKPIEKFLAENELKVKNALNFGNFRLKNRPEMQKLMEVNKRIALNMQDEKGAMRTTSQYIYYLIWTRDGGLNTSNLSIAGWSNPANWQADMQILNPVTSTEDTKGSFYGQLLSPVINKYEEDGLFYTLWPAFMHWTQTGNDKFTKGVYMQNLEAAMDWLERYSYDAEKQLFFRYYSCEDPLQYSKEWGYDQANGAPTNYSKSVYKGETIIKAYDIYINSLNAACYRMLSAMNSGDKALNYHEKAKRIEQKIAEMYDVSTTLPSYGFLQTVDNELIKAEPIGMDITDYQWALSLPLFKYNNHKRNIEVQRELYKMLRLKPTGMFLAGYNSILASLDTEIHNEDSIMAALDYLVPQSVRPGKFLPMPYTIPEIVNVKDGDPFHAVRPIMFSFAPWYAAVSNLGLRRLPFGIALRNTKYLENIDNYEFKGSLIDIQYKGEGKINKILVNKKELKGTYQLPENIFVKGENKIEVIMNNNAKPQNVLVSSTSKLLSAKNNNYLFQAYGNNTLCFTGLTKKINVTNEKGIEIKTVSTVVDEHTWIDLNNIKQNQCCS